MAHVAVVEDRDESERENRVEHLDLDQRNIYAQLLCPALVDELVGKAWEAGFGVLGSESWAIGGRG